MMLSYVLKTDYPSYRDLRNAVEYINRFTLQTGNPLLEPSTMYDCSLFTSWKFLHFSIGYQDISNAIIEWGGGKKKKKPVEENPKISLIKVQNFNRTSMMNIALSTSPKIEIWSPFVMLGFSKQWLSIESQNKICIFNISSLYRRTNNAFIFPRDGSESWIFLIKVKAIQRFTIIIKRCGYALFKNLSSKKV